MHTTIAINNETEHERRQRFEGWYDRYSEAEEVPTIITVHRVHDQWGGPEEGGWWYQIGEPIENICIFSREQGVQALLDLHAKYEAEEYEEEDYDINLATRYGTYYPEQRPHYE